MLKSWKNRPANRWYTALALATALASGTPRTGRAGQLTVTENLPNTGFTKTEILSARCERAANERAVLQRSDPQHRNWRQPFPVYLQRHFRR